MVRITATNKAKPRTVDVDLEEDEGAYPTFIPVTYQLPHSDEVIRNLINSPQINDISDKLDSVKEDITKSIGKLLKNGGSCRLCNIFKTEDSRTGEKGCLGFHGRESTHYKPHLSYNPEMKFEDDMKKLMRRTPGTLSFAVRAEIDDWRDANPVRKVQEEINKKAAGMMHNIDSPIWRKNTERDRFRKALDLPIPYTDYDEDEFYGLPRLSPLPRYRNTRIPTDHLLTRRRGYKFIS